MGWLYQGDEWRQSPKLEVSYDQFGRWYMSPAGEQYPSITTVLSVLSRDGIAAWRARVGDEEADAISNHAKERGTAMHDMLERWCLGLDPLKPGAGTSGLLADEINAERQPSEADWLAKQAAPETEPTEAERLAGQIIPELEQHVGLIYAVEAELYSDRLRTAGRNDLIAEWDGAVSVIDFKTSRKHKKPEWIQGYFQQATFYALAHWEMYRQIRAEQVVILIATDQGRPQVFKRSVHDHYRDLRNTRELFEETLAATMGVL